MGLTMSHYCLSLSCLQSMHDEALRPREDPVRGIETGWNEVAQANVVKVTENWVVAVVPMIYNDRVLLMRPDELATGWTAGFCYDKGGAAHLAALAWDPETDQYPVGFKKIAGDAR